MTPMKKTVLALGGLVLSITGAAAYYGHRKAGDVTTVWVVLAFALLMIPYFGLGFDPIVKALRDLGRASRFRLTMMGFFLLIPGVIVLMSGGGHLSLRNMVVLALYVSVPILVLAGWGQ